MRRGLLTIKEGLQKEKLKVNGKPSSQAYLQSKKGVLEEVKINSKNPKKIKVSPEVKKTKILIEKLENEKEGMQKGLNRKSQVFKEKRNDLVESFCKKLDAATRSLQRNQKKPEMPQVSDSQTLLLRALDSERAAELFATAHWCPSTGITSKKDDT